ncbi:MAG: hypothetical protein WCP62_16305 [Planctomycetota bacterium]
MTSAILGFSVTLSAWVTCPVVAVEVGFRLSHPTSPTTGRASIDAMNKSFNAIDFNASGFTASGLTASCFMVERFMWKRMG